MQKSELKTWWEDPGVATDDDGGKGGAPDNCIAIYHH